MLKPHLISTVNQKVLSLLVKFPDQEFYEREVSRKLGISSGAASTCWNPTTAGAQDSASLFKN